MVDRLASPDQEWGPTPEPPNRYPATMTSLRFARKTSARLSFAVAAALASIAMAPAAQAAVDRIEILSRTPLSGGKTFGNAGAFERITGRLHYAVDPADRANATIVDLALAPRDVRGRVPFAGDFTLIRPVNGSSDKLLFEVNNRGNQWLFNLFQDGTFSNQLSDDAVVGDGWLLKQGYSLLWTAWNWDVVPGGDRQAIDLPVARAANGTPITGPVISEIVVAAPAKAASHVGILAKGYAFAKDQPAVLTVRDTPTGKRTVIPLEQWQLARLDGDRVVPDDKSVYLPAGFEPGRIYELAYTAKDPVVVGLGLAAIRDSLSFFRYAKADAQGTPNPLTESGGHLPKHALAFGISQSGRVIQELLLQGLTVDEQGRPIFDGAFVHAAGAGKGGFNYRFAQTTRHFSPVDETLYPTDYFPFTTVTQTDPVTGQRGSVLAKARAQHAVPKLIYTSTSTDYWARAASLLHTDTEGKRDLPLDPNARLYHLSGAQHVVARPAVRSPNLNCTSPVDYRPQLRALLVGLDAWVVAGQQPPASRYGRIADGTLVDLPHYLQSVMALPGTARPNDYLRPPRLDLGPRFATQGISDLQPPSVGARFGALVPAVDKEGNERVGLAAPQVQVPLGSYVGWNLRAPGTGGAGALVRLHGSFLPFAATDAARQAAGDARPSLEARYGSRDGYLAKVRAAAQTQVQQGLLLARDLPGVVSQAGAFYDRIVAQSPSDTSCKYLAG
ncbi:MAG: alpha/beta hydrolase domain-containing protein [Burkholderiaceae bacterium]